jgi:hypothetical protein
MLGRILKILVLIILALLLAGCTSISETATRAAPTLPATPPQLTSTPQNLPPTETPTPLPPTPTPGIQLPQTDQVIFTILNPQPWSGREGDLRPDWLGWGAETFAAAPDGTFWIADSAASPHRLLHYTAQGELLQEFSLPDVVIYPFDLVAAQDSLWVLDISGMSPRVIQLSTGGTFLSSVDIPPESMMMDSMVVSNGAFNILLGEAGELLLNTLNGYYQLVDASGLGAVQPLEALSYYGHTYQVGPYDRAAGQLPFYVDGARLETPPDFQHYNDTFLGFNPDGSFAVASNVQTAKTQWDYQVQYYRASGELLGNARQQPQLYINQWNHHLAFGPDGAIYQLVSYPDHSVQIVRLGFSAQLPPIVETPVVISTPLATMLPSASATTDEEQARNALLAFFANLSSGNYADAAPLFGGEIEEYFRQPEPGESPEAYWADICRFLWCLPIVEITSAEQVSADEYLFYVVFVHPEWGRFEIGACCGGDPAAHPPVWQFAYPVKRIDGVWKVMRAPLFTP